MPALVASKVGLVPSFTSGRDCAQTGVVKANAAAVTSKVKVIRTAGVISEESIENRLQMLRSVDRWYLSGNDWHRKSRVKSYAGGKMGRKSRVKSYAVGGYEFT